MNCFIKDYFCCLVEMICVIESRNVRTYDIGSGIHRKEPQRSSTMMIDPCTGRTFRCPF